MAVSRRFCSSSVFRMPNLNFSTSCSFSNKWRIQNGLEREPRQFSPLTKLLDYSFLDGRPVPLSGNQKRKILHQQKLCKQIVELTHEIDIGLEQYYQKKELEEKNREAIIKNKLKPKGAALLTGNKMISGSEC